MRNEIKNYDTVESIEARMRAIDERVATLEKCNDRHIARFGEYNYALYNSIQELMDERDELFKRKIKLEKEKKFKEIKPMNGLTLEEAKDFWDDIFKQENERDNES